MEGHIAIAMRKEFWVILGALTIWNQQTTFIFKNGAPFQTMQATHL
jgi:hypothetical protein